MIGTSELFDREWYLSQYEDVRAAGVDPLRHYVRHGFRENRSPSSLFDGEWYLAANPDVADADMNPLFHYLAYGRAEGRSAKPISPELKAGDHELANGSAAPSPEATVANYDWVQQALRNVDSALQKRDWEKATAWSERALRDNGSAILNEVYPRLSTAERLRNLETYLAQVESHRWASRAAREQSSNKIVMYTAIAGSYDSIRLPEYLAPDISFVLFSEIDAARYGPFDVRAIPYFHIDPTRAARFVKTHPHHLLPEFDIAIWIDSNIAVRADIGAIIEAFVASGKAVAGIPHRSALPFTRRAWPASTTRKSSRASSWSKCSDTPPRASNAKTSSRPTS